MIYFISNKITKQSLGDEIKITGVEKLIEYLSNEKEIVLDVETTGFHPIKDKIITLQLGFRNNIQFVIDIRDLNISQFKSFLEDETKTFIGHNIKFDYNFLKQYNIVLRNVYDTMIVDKIIYNGVYSPTFIRMHKRFSLAGVYKHHFNKTIDKKQQLGFTKLHDEPLSYDQIKYAGLDVLYPFYIKDKQQELISKYDLKECENLENKFVLALADIEYNGMPLNVKKWLDAVKIYAQRAKNTEKELDSLLLENPLGIKFKKQFVQLTLFDFPIDDRKTIVNWNSDQQVLQILHEIFNIFPITKEGKPSSGADAIELLPNQYPFTEVLLRYREEMKVVTSFGQEFVKKYVDFDKRIRPSFNQIIDTGRLSSRNPNIQQIKNYDGHDLASKLFRESFCVENNQLISNADYNSEESRVMADMANDESYIKFFNEDGGDPHSFVATKLFSAAFKKDFIVSKNKNPEYRQKGKTLNFSISYGASAFTLSKRLKIPESEAQQLINAFFEGFPKLKLFFEDCKKFAIEHGYIRTNDIIKRIRWFPLWRRYMELQDKRGRSREENTELLKIRGRIERQAANTRIQGSSGDIMKLALIKLRNKLLQANILPLYNAEIMLINTLHDELQIECNKSNANFCTTIHKECMEEAGAVICKKVKITADVKLSNHWEH